MKKLFLWAVLCVAAAFSSCSKHDNEINDVEPPVPPETTPLAIAFVEGNSLQFDANETKIVHYTITGGSDNTVVKAELQSPNNAYTVETAPTSATQGTIMITAKMLSTYNRILVSVSDGDQSVSAEITVSTTSKITITVETPGTLSQLLADYDATKIRELTVIGNLNSLDIKTLKDLSELAVIDMEQVNLEVLPTDAFYEKTSLKSVKLPKTLKIIGDYAFRNCSSLKSITIPDSVTSIGDYAFAYCTSLTNVTIPDSVTEIGGDAFYGCTSLSAFYGKFASPDNRCLIVDGKLVAFAPAGLTSYTIPDSVTEIGECAFENCKGLTSVTIPDSVTEIGDHVFWGCSSLTSITIPDNVTSIGLGAFAYCTSLTNVTISDSVTEIGEGTFENCSGLTSVTIGNRVTTIGNGAFIYCSSLTSVTIPNSVTSIGYAAFSKCSGLTSVTIGNRVTTIGFHAFMNCSRLTNIYSKAQTPPSLGYDVFFNVSATLYVPTGRAAAYAAADEWKKFTTIIETEF